MANQVWRIEIEKTAAGVEVRSPSGTRRMESWSAALADVAAEVHVARVDEAVAEDRCPCCWRHTDTPEGEDYEEHAPTCVLATPEALDTDERLEALAALVGGEV